MKKIRMRQIFPSYRLTLLLGVLRHCFSFVKFYSCILQENDLIWVKEGIKDIIVVVVVEENQDKVRVSRINLLTAVPIDGLVGIEVAWEILNKYGCTSGYEVSKINSRSAWLGILGTKPCLFISSAMNNTCSKMIEIPII